MAALRALSRYLLLLLFLMPAGVLAGPWADPGDARLKTDVELLKANGFIAGPVSAWPVTWAQIDAGIENARLARGLSPALRAAADRLETLSMQNRQPSRYLVRARFTNDAALVRGAADTARNPADITIAASHDIGERFSITWGGSFQSNGSKGQEATRHGNGFSLAPTQVALGAGNWIFYGGWIDTQWGPGHDGSLLFSTSARAFPRIGVRTMMPKPINLPVLKLLGPVDVEAFVGKENEKREFDNPMLIGMRFSFQPFRHFEVGLKRGLMLCGKNRPCDLKTIGSAVTGLGNADNTGTADEPGNQLAGFDLAFRHPIGRTGHALLLTFDTVAEDEDNILVEQFARQIGAAVVGPVGSGGSLYKAGVEYTDTQAARFLGKLQGGQTWPGSMYNHFLYINGWTYHHRPLGYSLDGDARALTFHGEVIDTKNRRWYGSVRSITLNLHEIPRYRISRTREKIAVVTGGVDWPTEIGDLRLEARIQHNAPDTPDSSPLRVQAEIGWTSRF